MRKMRLPLPHRARARRAAKSSGLLSETPPPAVRVAARSRRTVNCGDGRGRRTLYFASECSPPRRAPVKKGWRDVDRVRARSHRLRPTVFGRLRRSSAEILANDSRHRPSLRAPIGGIFMGQKGRTRRASRTISLRVRATSFASASFLKARELDLTGFNLSHQTSAAFKELKR